MVSYNTMEREVYRLKSLTYQEALEAGVVHMYIKGEKAGPSLRGHIVKQHFSPYVLAWFGVARFDIDLAKRANIPLDWVVKKGIDRLENGWPEVKPDFFAQTPRFDNDALMISDMPWGEYWCKTMIVKNLMYIDQSGTAKVDWDKVVAAFAGASAVTLDINRDSVEPFNPYKPFKQDENSRRISTF